MADVHSKVRGSPFVNAKAAAKTEVVTIRQGLRADTMAMRNGDGGK